MANLAQRLLWKVRIGLLPVTLLTSALLWPLTGLAADLEGKESELTTAGDTLSVAMKPFQVPSVKNRTKSHLRDEVRKDELRPQE
jgi:hypothetical protein